MKTLVNLFIAVLSISMWSCNSNSADKSSTEVAMDSNKKELNAKDSTELKDDAKFAVEAANGGMLEVELGKLAKSKATSPQVIKFADMMVMDHAKANKELTALAGSKFITLPAILGSKFQMDYDNLAKLDKKDFDKAYIEYMIKDHKEDIEEFKKEAEDGKDTGLKAFATKTVPTLQQHLQMAQDAGNAVKK